MTRPILHLLSGVKRPRGSRGKRTQRGLHPRRFRTHHHHSKVVKPHRERWTRTAPMQGVEPCCAVAADPRCRGSAAPWISHGHAPAMSSPIGSSNPNRDRMPGPGDISAHCPWRIIQRLCAYSLPRTLSRALAEQSRMSTHVPTGIRISDRSNALLSPSCPHRDRANLAIGFVRGPIVRRMRFHRSGRVSGGSRRDTRNLDPAPE